MILSLPSFQNTTLVQELTINEMRKLKDSALKEITIQSQKINQGNDINLSCPEDEESCYGEKENQEREITKKIIF